MKKLLGFICVMFILFFISSQAIAATISFTNLSGSCSSNAEYTVVPEGSTEPTVDGDSDTSGNNSQASIEYWDNSNLIVRSQSGNNYWYLLEDNNKKIEGGDSISFGSVVLYAHAEGDVSGVQSNPYDYGEASGWGTIDKEFSLTITPDYGASGSVEALFSTHDSSTVGSYDGGLNNLYFEVRDSLDVLKFSWDFEDPDVTNKSVWLNYNETYTVIAYLNHSFSHDSDMNGSFINNYNGFVLMEVGEPVPLPPAFWLLGSGLIGIVGIRRKFKT
jgi:hypothetical protein